MKLTLIRVHLTITEPWTIAAPEANAETSVLLSARDPFGNITIPTSSVAGSLRAHLSQADLPVDELMGTVEGDAAVPSAIRLLGTSVTLPTGRSTETIKRTAIDSSRGAAAAGNLMEVEQAPAGTEVTIDLRVDGSPAWLDEFLAALAGWQPFIGRQRTSGKGSAHVTSLRHGILDMQNSADLTLWLSSGGPALIDSVATISHDIPDAKSRRPLLDGPVVLTATDGVFVMDPKKNVGNKRAPYQRDNAYVIEGSSWKGVLRSRSGYIVRTLGGTACTNTAGCDAPECAVCHLFGSGSQRAALRITATALRPRRLQSARHHVAIDRFSGGARDSGLYTDTNIPIGATMGVVIEAIAPHPDWTEQLLRAVFLDIHDGYVGVGSSTTRGLGTATLDDAVAANYRSALGASSLRDALAAWTTGRKDSYA